MITLSAKINLLEGDNQDLSVLSTTNSKSNISSQISSVLGYKAQGRNPFLLGSSKLGENATFSNGEKYYIGNVSANSEGVFPSRYEIIITNPKRNIVTLLFDDYNNQFPTSINVNGNVYENDNAIFTIPVEENLETTNVRIYNWNTPNMPFRLQGVFINVDIQIDRRNIISLSSNIMSRTDVELPSWGIISNSARATFNDVTGEIKDYIELGLLKKGLEVVISLNNTISNKNQVVGTFKTTDWDYDNDNRQITVTYKDELEEWQEINIEGINYDPRKPQHATLIKIYTYLYEQTIKNGYTIKSFEQLDTETKTALNGTVLVYPFLNNGTLWQSWTKLCEVAQLYIYTEKDGTINCVYGGM